MITPFGELPDRLAVGMSMDEQHEWLTRPISRRAALRVASLAGLAPSALLPAAAIRDIYSPTPTTSAGPTSGGRASTLVGRQVVFGADPTLDITVAFALTVSFLSASVRATAQDTGRVTEAVAQRQPVPGTQTVYARAALTGLAPGSAFAYVVVVDGVEVAGGTFRTAQRGGHPFRFTAFGDQGTGVSTTPMLAQIARLDPSLHLFAGDLSYADVSGMGGPGDIFRPQIWDRWIAQNDGVASRIPWMCAPGNHEMEPGFALHGYAGMLARVPIGGSSPLGVPVASSFRVGTVGFIGLDSNDVSYEIPANRGWAQGRQTEWLAGTLAAMRQPAAAIDFVVVFMHASPYTSNGDHPCEAGIREQWVPLFDEHSVDLVISGHNHCYERTLAIRRGLPSTDLTGYAESSAGTTYVTAGGGGASTSNYQFVSGPTARVRDADGYHREPAPWVIPADRRNEYNVLSVDVVPASQPGGQAMLNAVAYDHNGAELDRFVLVRSAGSGAAVAAAASDPPTASTSSATPLVIGGGLVVLAATAAGGLAVVRSRRVRQPREVAVGQTSNSDVTDPSSKARP